MEFLKNFFREDDRVVGLCAFKKKSSKNLNTEQLEFRFNATKLLYEPKIKYNFFMI